MRFKTSSKFVEYCHPEIQVHNQYKQLSTMFNFISDMFFNSDPYWICPYISRHLLSLNPLQARCRRYSRGER
ncbi:hypothetical protein C5K18_15415 [Shigella dysenteriae]|uniref:Uncharacterized protein n=1 Tax=Shigella dysenteriae TaxID=622 RepID=A0A2S8DAW3_SHIDY|nr:hypothetical protein C5K18_15415 [Shigella dysenteriae]